jgi:hypothetical protein
MLNNFSKGRKRNHDFYQDFCVIKLLEKVIVVEEAIVFVLHAHGAVEI